MEYALFFLGMFSGMILTSAIGLWLVTNNQPLVVDDYDLDFEEYEKQIEEQVNAELRVIEGEK